MVQCSVSLLIFCLDDLCTVESGVLKSPTITALLSVSPLISVNICLTYLSALMLGAYTADPLNNTDLNSAGPLKCGLFNKCSTT